MVQVPITTRNTVDPQPIGREVLQYSAPRNFIGPALQGAGEALANFAEEKHDEQLHFASATAKDAFNQVQQYYADQGFSGDASFYNLRGKDAVTARPQFESDLNAKIEELRKTLGPFAQTLFNRALSDQGAEWTRQIGSHVTTETERYNVEQTASRAKLALQAAGTTIQLGHPGALEESDKQIATARDEYDQLGRFQGWSPERTEYEKSVNVSATRRDIGQALVNSGPQGPDAADAYFEKYKTDFTPDDAASLQGNIRAMRNAQEAEQRRIEAEQRREAAEQRREAGDRAADAARLADAGVPLTPDQVAAAESDARTANRPGLEFSIRQASFKNNLTLQWQDSTPAEIQNRLNEIGPQLAGAKGDKALELRTEYDHLSTLLGKSNAELGSDPLSWGASHMGLKVPALDWTNQASINARVAAARQVSGRTGAPLRVLTNEEAASFAPTVASGSMAQRRALVTQLARFGSLGASAAAQVAPGNDQFISLIGLATGSSHSASAQHVEAVLAGQEILKTNPKLIAPDKAHAVFASQVGGALELLPSLARGVEANAMAMAATGAQHNGATTWDNGGGTAFRHAVNDALGGYRAADGMRGGLHIYNGRKTLMPDGWSAAQFEQTISRASVDKWHKGMNGGAVDASGKGFTFGQLKKMQWVAVGDGRYRLTDGAHYVGRQGGGIFEVDVRKVR